MAARTVISVRGLGKRYQLGETFSSGTLRDAMATGASRLLRRQNGARTAVSKDFWALKDVSFDVAEGEVLGIIGSNGAGKSTLLKILSGITDPTEGEVRMRGRVGALLEVGTGFHQELSGRENVFMNGAILGMSQVEIRKKFDEIVAFAGVEPFIDTPVKRYSSGMLVRLGFAVAAHLEPEILVIDEVLAVGDEEFQRKCIRKMDDVSKSGRTVLFVSHNMAAVESLCSRCVLVGNGELMMSGTPDEAIAAYRSNRGPSSGAEARLTTHPGRPSERSAIMLDARILNSDGRVASGFHPGDSVQFEVTHGPLHRDISPVLGIVLKSAVRAPILGVDNRFVGGYRLAQIRGPGRISCVIPDLPLVPGHYFVDLFFGDSFRSLDSVVDALAFEVLSSDVYGTGRLPPPACGPVLWRAKWAWESTTAPSMKSTDFVAAAGVEHQGRRDFGE